MAWPGLAVVVAWLGLEAAAFKDPPVEECSVRPAVGSNALPAVGCSVPLVEASNGLAAWRGFYVECGVGRSELARGKVRSEVLGTSLRCGAVVTTPWAAR